MDAELEKYHKANKNLELQLSDLNLKLRATEKNVATQRATANALGNSVTRFRADLQGTIQHVQDPKKLAANVKSLYTKHCVEAKAEEHSMDEDVQLEHNRQRDFLERNISSLKKKLAKAEELHRTETTRIMRENVALIKEINDLRKELRNSKLTAQKLEGTLKTTRTLAEMRGATLPTREETMQMSGGS